MTLYLVILHNLRIAHHPIQTNSDKLSRIHLSKFASYPQLLFRKIPLRFMFFWGSQPPTFRISDHFHRRCFLRDFHGSWRSQISWVETSHSIINHPSSITSISYPLAIEHSYWKWPSRNSELFWCPRIKMLMFHSYVNVYQRVSRMIKHQGCLLAFSVCSTICQRLEASGAVF